jgi:hypothetical protein
MAISRAVRQSFSVKHQKTLGEHGHACDEGECSHSFTKRWRHVMTTRLFIVSWKLDGMRGTYTQHESYPARSAYYSWLISCQGGQREKG